jgi:carbonic anhydrase
MLGGVSAVVEFAVSGLGVQHIVICGHTHCGAMQALLEPNSVDNMPTVRSWLKNAHAALQVTESIKAMNGGERDVLEVLTEQNVLLQMQHLKTHPSVAGAMALGRLSISGWIYNIGTGDVCVVEDGKQTFTPVGESLPTGV